MNRGLSWDARERVGMRGSELVRAKVSFEKYVDTFEEEVIGRGGGGS